MSGWLSNGLFEGRRDGFAIGVEHCGHVSNYARQRVGSRSFKSEVCLFKDCETDLARVMARLVGYSIRTVRVIPQSIRPKAARFIGPSRNRVVRPDSLQSRSIQAHNPQRSVRGKHGYGAPDDIRHGHHETLRIAHKGFGQGAAKGQSGIEELRTVHWHCQNGSSAACLGPGRRRSGRVTNGGHGATPDRPVSRQSAAICQRAIREGEAPGRKDRRERPASSASRKPVLRLTAQDAQNRVPIAGLQRFKGRSPTKRRVGR